MLEKKLLTLASAAGILACGACFLAPLPQRRLPAPLAPVFLQGVHIIHLTVKNESATGHLDPAELATQFAGDFNWQLRNRGIHAWIDDARANPDAIFEIVVQRETVEQDVPATASRPGRIAYFIEDSATLTRPDGAILWQETGIGNKVERSADFQEANDPWNQRGLARNLDFEFVANLVRRMLDMR